MRGCIIAADYIWRLLNTRYENSSLASNKHSQGIIAGFTGSADLYKHARATDEICDVRIALKKTKILQ